MFSQSFKAHFSPSGFYTIRQLTWGRIAIINGIFAAEGFFFVPGRWTEKAEKQDGERKRERERAHHSFLPADNSQHLEGSRNWIWAEYK